ncbi:MAG TPA: hypothetical protein VF139_12975 [Candidatus Polarisedimenticolaceae bacterium]
MRVARLFGPIFALAVVLGARDAAAEPPLQEAYLWEGQDDVLWDCGDFDILDTWSMEGITTYYWNKDGTLDRYRSHGDAIDLMKNSVTGKTVLGRTEGYNFFEDVEGEPGVWKHAGLMYHVVVPGVGTVLIDTGIFYMVDGEVTYIKGNHEGIAGDYDQLCAALR